MGEVLFTTNDVANILRVDKSTIKRWTDEGKLKCFRTPGGHRKFRSEDVYEFMTTNHYDQQSLQTLPRMMSDEMIIRSIVHKREYNVLHSVCFSATIKGKKEEILQLLNESVAAGMSIAEVCDHLLHPTTKKLDHLVTLEKITVSEFSLAMNVLTSAITHISESIRKLPRNHKTVVCAAMENGKNETELAALVTVLEVNGYTVLNLGAGINAEAITQFVTRTKPFAVCLHASFVSDRGRLAAALKTIADSARANGSHCIAGGAGFSHESFRSIDPVTFCATFSEIEAMPFGITTIMSALTHQSKP